MAPESRNSFLVLKTGDVAFARMADAIAAAQHTVRLEMYIFKASAAGERFRDLLILAARRGVRVHALIDSFGSITLLDSFWTPLRQAGGEMRWFNPLTLRRFNIRNHRKLLACDDRVAIVGGFNVAPEYEGDGVTRGWADLGLQINGPLVTELAASFDDMFERADFQHKRFIRLRKRPHARSTPAQTEELLLSGPGRGGSPIKHSLRRDLFEAHTVQIIVAYFLPPRRLRRALMLVARRGGRVQLILPGKTDVPLSQLAARSLYQGLLRNGIEIYEYQPQILHAKVFLVDDIVYAGSSNLDTRSLNINYELLVRLHQPQLAAEARAVFAEYLAHSQQVHRMLWRKSRTFWNKFKERWAYLLFTRLDPYVARWQLRGMR
jgi:cardiolipin synthase